MARQPILDTGGRVHAYELLFRNGPFGEFGGDGELATRTMIDNGILFGFDKLTGGIPAFLNCTAHTLTEEQVDILPPSTTVIEVLENVEPLPELIRACQSLKSRGYRIALDDFVWKPSLKPLVGLADYIKVDFIQSDRAHRRNMLSELRDYPVALLAEKIETQETYDEACAEGFRLFQGYYFSRPMLLVQRKIPANHGSYFRLLQAMNDEPLDIGKVSELVKRDVSLTYRLLRLVNSPVCAIRQEVHSIETALMVVGDDRFRRIVTLAIASQLNRGRPSEILRMAFVRGRFCELSAGMCNLDSAEQYLMGVFSLLPAMLQAPMERVTAELPLRQPVRDALLGEPNDMRCPLEWLESHERGNWSRCDALASAHGLDQDQLQMHFNASAVWADQILSAES